MEKTNSYIDTFIEQRLAIATVTDPNIENHHLMSMIQFLDKVVTPQGLAIAHNLGIVETSNMGRATLRGKLLLATIASLTKSLIVFLSYHDKFNFEIIKAQGKDDVDGLDNFNIDLIEEHWKNTVHVVGNDKAGFTFIWLEYVKAEKAYRESRNDFTANALFVAFEELLVVLMMQLIEFAKVAETSGREDTFPATVFNDPFRPMPIYKNIESYSKDPRMQADLLEAIITVSHINTIAGKGPEPMSVEVTPEKIRVMTYDSLVQIPIVVSELREGIASLKAGNVSPFNHSGFRDDVQDIRFTAAGGLGYIKIPALVPKMYFEQICNDVIKLREFPDTQRIIFLLESFCNDLEAAAKELDKWHGTKGLEMLYDIYYNLFMVVSALGRLYGYDVHSDWVEVCTSNYTKFDREFEDIGPSCKKYLQQGIVVLPTLSPCGEYYAYIVPYDQCIDGKHYPQGKYLKSHKFQEPNYDRTPTTSISSTMVG